MGLCDSKGYRAKRLEAAGGLAVLLASLWWFVFLSQRRLIAGDEGFYLMASKLTLEGKTPYLDFFYPQMPLLPYIYGLFMKAFGVGWGEGRFFSALLSSVLCLLIFYRCRSASSLIGGFFGAFLFAFSAMVFPWFVTVKTYPLSVFFLFVSYLLMCSAKKGAVWSLLAGVSLGCSVSTRLFFCVLVPLFGWYIFTKKGRRGFWWFVLGNALALVPATVLALKDWESFWFCNLGYHLIRSDIGFWDSLRSKGTIAKIIFGIRGTRKFCGIHFAVLLVLSFGYFLYSRLKKIEIDPSFLIMLFLLIVSFLPVPSYVQYFSVLSPFAVICTVLILRDLWRGKGKIAVVLIVLVLGYEYSVSLISDVERYTKTGEGVIGIRGREEAKNKTLASLREISRAVDGVLRGGETVISIWPGYIVSSKKAKPYPGTENHFALKSAHKVNKDRWRRFHLISYEAVGSAIRERKVRVVVMSAKAYERRYREDLKYGGYLKESEVRGVYIFVKDGQKSDGKGSF
ncbi:MAG: hypothetical protein D6808_05800 [Candidatus Dadabacteria bacterium]|nr:MAG: hypothetical protein D6808_05800 [Candidatus Dadabacteria bacterium]